MGAPLGNDREFGYIGKYRKHDYSDFPYFYVFLYFFNLFFGVFVSFFESLGPPVSIRTDFHSFGRYSTHFVHFLIFD